MKNPVTLLEPATIRNFWVNAAMSQLVRLRQIGLQSGLRDEERLEKAVIDIVNALGTLARRSRDEQRRQLRLHREEAMTAIHRREMLGIMLGARFYCSRASFACGAGTQ